MQIAQFFPKRLITRLVLLMTLALLPLGLISISQTKVVVEEAEALSRASLLGRTRDVASEERRLVQNALGAAQGMASVALALDPEQCTQAMQRLVADTPDFIFAGFVPLNGQMTCSSAGETVDLTRIPGFESEIRRDGPFVQINPNGAVTNRPVLIVSQPVRNENGVQGRMTISIPHWIADESLDDQTPVEGLKIASFNSEGQIIAATHGIASAQAYLPADIALADLPERNGETFRALANDGRERLFAITALVDGTLYLVGSWPADTASGGSAVLGDTAPALFPALMWLAGMGVAVLGLQHLVLRHLSDLRSAMRQFALGERNRDGLTLKNPPQEFEDAARAFNRMAFILTEAEARQEADLRDKEVLLREVHHRVKNNLQLIASIMNMQMRRARSQEARQLLAGLQQRVRGLAMLHRTLYTTTEVTTIDSRDLIETVVADASNLIPDCQMEVVTDLASFPLYPDQAVPLSMLVAEALTNAFKYSDTTRLHDPVRVVLEEHGANIARLTVTNPVAEGQEQDAEDMGDGLGSQLLKAFIRQLDGTADSKARDGHFVFDITFERRDFESDADA